LLTDFVCLLIYEFWLSLWKIALCSVILLLPLYIIITKKSKQSYLLKNLINIKLYVMLLKEALNTINPHILWQTPEQFSYPLWIYTFPHSTVVCGSELECQTSLIIWYGPERTTISLSLFILELIPKEKNVECYALRYLNLTPIDDCYKCQFSLRQI